jgi:hypothetical protein
VLLASALDSLFADEDPPLAVPLDEADALELLSLVAESAFAVSDFDSVDSDAALVEPVPFL